MTFFPDGEVRIPKQTTAPETGRPASTSDPAAFRRHFQRTMRRTVLINAPVLAAAVLLAYVFPVSDDEDVALVIVVAAAVVCMLHLVLVTVVAIRRQAAQSRA